MRRFATVQPKRSRRPRAFSPVPDGRKKDRETVKQTKQ